MTSRRYQKFKAAFVLGLLSVLWAMMGAVPLQAQTHKAPRTVEVDFAQTFNFIQYQGKTLQKLVGDVQLHQDSVHMYCDSAIIEDRYRVQAFGNVVIQQGDTAVIFADSLTYYIQTRQAELFGNVILVNGEQKLYTNRLQYDLNTKLATYTDGAVLTNGQSRLKSKRGYFFVEQKEVYFRNGVEVTDPEFSLKSDTLKFNVDTKTAYFLGPTIIATGESKIYTESGFYNTETNFAEFNRNAQFVRGIQKATADTIRYDGKFEVFTLQQNAWFEEGERRATAELIQHDQRANKTFLKGSAYLRDGAKEIYSQEVIYDAKNKTFKTRGRSRISDPPQILEADEVDTDEASGLNLAMGNVVWQDTAAQLAIACAQAAYDRESGFIKASGGKAGRPMLTTLLDGDTLFMTADTLVSLRVQSSETDSSRLLLAFRDVRILKNDLQAVCDSLAYHTQDSIFRLYRMPVIWSDTSQFSADTILLTLRNNKIHTILLQSNGFIINSPDGQFFNQIKGRQITAYFREDELRVMDVSGNAQSIYYARDDDGAYIGVNQTVCSDMVLYFGSNRIERIKFLAEPKSRLEPMQQADHRKMRLEGFRWDEVKPCRPLALDDLFGQPCAVRLVPTAPSSPVPAFNLPEAAAQPGPPAREARRQN